MAVFRARIAAVPLGILMIFASAAINSAAAEPQAAADCPATIFAAPGRQLSDDALDAVDDLACANLQGADLANLQLDQKDLHGADLRGANLSGADLTQATLTGADFTGADLRKADFTQAHLGTANLTSAKLSGARMGQADLRGATLTGADLTNADLDQVHGEGADFTGANLTGSSFIQADLDNAKFDRANLSGAGFSQADTAGASYQGITGTIRWDVYLLWGSVALLVLLTLQLIASVGRRKTMAGDRTRMLIYGFLGRLMIVFGIHLFVGALLGQVGAAAGVPPSATCVGPQCAVGVNVGFVGLFIGIAIFIAGTFVCSLARIRRYLPGGMGRRMLARAAFSGPGPAVSVQVPGGAYLVNGVPMTQDQLSAGYPTAGGGPGPAGTTDNSPYGPSGGYASPGYGPTGYSPGYPTGYPAADYPPVSTDPNAPPTWGTPPGSYPS